MARRVRSMAPAFLFFVGMASMADAQSYTRVSVASDGTLGNGNSNNPVFSGDGKIVGFTSSATNLVAGDTNGTDDVFVRDLSANTTARVSIASDGTERIGASGKAAPGGTHRIGPEVSLSQDGA